MKKCIYAFVVLSIMFFTFTGCVGSSREDEPLFKALHDYEGGEDAVKSKGNFTCIRSDNEERRASDELCNRIVEIFNGKTFQVGDVINLKSELGDLFEESKISSVRRSLKEIFKDNGKDKEIINVNARVSLEVSYTEDKIIFTVTEYYNW